MSKRTCSTQLHFNKKCWPTHRLSSFEWNKFCTSDGHSSVFHPRRPWSYRGPVFPQHSSFIMSYITRHKSFTLAGKPGRNKCLITFNSTALTVCDFLLPSILCSSVSCIRVCSAFYWRSYYACSPCVLYVIKYCTNII